MTRQANQAEFELFIGGVTTPLKVYEFSGHEQLSQCFVFDIEFVCEEPELELEALLQQQACLCIHDKDSSRYVHGVIESLSQITHELVNSRYRLRLVPRLKLLDYKSGYRIYQDLSVEEILQQLLQEAGFTSVEYQFSLNQTHEPKTYCVQYDETDLAFIQRLMAEAGIHYHFAFDKDKHTVVFSDDQQGFALLPALEYQPDAGLNQDHKVISSLILGEQVRTGEVCLRDFDPQKPTFMPQGREFCELSNQVPLSEYFYPGEFVTEAEGNALARLSLERRRSLSQWASGTSDSPQLYAGGLQPVTLHPDARLNQDWVLAQVVHTGHQPQALEALADGASHYSATFKAAPWQLVWRPDFQPKPRVKGIDTAIVTGPAGEEIYTDEQGRVKVQFHWDKEGQGDEKSSCWLRVSQTWAGNGFGQFVLPRIGQEVIVSFVHGDPDKPLVTGAVHNGTNLPPYDLPEHKTRSSIKSASSIGAENDNELRFEDKAGSEQIYLHGARDLDRLIDNESREEITESDNLRVEGRRFEQVEQDWHLITGGDRVESVAGDVALNIGGSQRTQIDGSAYVQVGTALGLEAGAKIVLQAGSSISLAAGGSFVTIDPGGVTVCGAKVNLNSGGGPGSAKAVDAEPSILPLDADTDNAGLVPETREAEQIIALKPLAQFEHKVVQAAAEEQPLITECQKRADGSCPLSDCPCGNYQG